MIVLYTQNSKSGTKNNEPRNFLDKGNLIKKKTLNDHIAISSISLFFLEINT